MKIYIDADACPVKSLCAEAAIQHEVKALFICSVASQFVLKGKWIRIITVDQGFQSVDLYIANHIKKGDIVLTDDYGLACIALSRGCSAMSFRGKEYTNHNIELLLANRHENVKARRAGKRTRGPRTLTAKEKWSFKKSLDKMIEKKEGDC